MKSEKFSSKKSKQETSNVYIIYSLHVSGVFYICWFLELEICSSQQSLNVFNEVCNEILFVNHNSTFRFKLSITTLVSGFHHQPSNTKEDDVDSERSKGLCLSRHKRLHTPLSVLDIKNRVSLKLQTVTLPIIVKARNSSYYNLWLIFNYIPGDICL